MAKAGIKEGRNKVWVQFYTITVAARDEFGNEVFYRNLNVSDWHLKIIDHEWGKLKDQFTKDRQYYISEGEIEDYLSKKTAASPSKEANLDKDTK